MLILIEEIYLNIPSATAGDGYPVQTQKKILFKQNTSLALRNSNIC